MSRRPNCICKDQGYPKCSGTGEYNFRRTDPLNIDEVDGWSDEHSIILCSACYWDYHPVFYGWEGGQLTAQGFMGFVTEALDAAEVRAMMRSPLSAPKQTLRTRARDAQATARPRPNWHFQPANHTPHSTPIPPTLFPSRGLGRGVQGGSRTPPRARSGRQRARSATGAGRRRR